MSMTIKHWYWPALLWTATAVLTSCIRKDVEDCQPLSVSIAVGDKNYSNIDEMAALGVSLQPEDESQPFVHYVKKLYYVLQDKATGKTVYTRHLHDVAGDRAMATAYLPADLPFGEYVLTVWGNIQSETPISEDGTSYNFHINQSPGYDVYMTCDTLLYDAYHARHTVSLRRLKGKLVIEAEQMPDGIRLSRKTIDGLSATVGQDMEYGGSATVATAIEWDGDTAEEMSSQTFLSPTSEGRQSRLDMAFHDDPEDTAPLIAPGSIQVRMERNAITYVRYVYDHAAGRIEAYLAVDGGWKQIYDLEIGEAEKP